MQKKRNKVLVVMPPETIQELDLLAEVKRRNRSDVIRQACEDLIEKMKAENSNYADLLGRRNQKQNQSD